MSGSQPGKVSARHAHALVGIRKRAEAVHAVFYF
jgi:hypothetical protein